MEEKKLYGFFKSLGIKWNYREIKLTPFTVEYLKA